MLGQVGAQDARRSGAVLQRRGIVVKLDQARKPLADLPQQFADAGHAVAIEIGSDTAGHDPIHHQPMTECIVRRPQHMLAQNPAMRVHQRKRRVVADRADIAEMVRQPLQFRHQRAQELRARRRFDAEHRFDRMRKGDAVSDGAVARGTRGEPRRLFDRRAGHQRLDAFVHVAEPLFEPHHGFAAGGEAKMSRLDDSGMHRADRNLMQAFAFDGKEPIGVTNRRRLFARAERMLHGPEAEIEPWPRIRQADSDVAIKTVNGAFETDGRRMQRADGGIASIRTGETCHRDIAVGVSHDRHVYRRQHRPVGPQSEKRGMARGDFAREPAAKRPTSR